MRRSFTPIEKVRSVRKERSSLSGFTLAELMVATLVLVIGVVSVLSIYFAATFAIRQAKSLTIAAKDAGSVLEHIKSLTLAEIRSYKDDSAYWDSVLTKILSGESIAVENMDASDMGWSNDPLELKVTVTWSERGRSSNVEMFSKFTDE